MKKLLEGNYFACNSHNKWEYTREKYMIVLFAKLYESTMNMCLRRYNEIQRMIRHHFSSNKNHTLRLLQSVSDCCVIFISVVERALYLNHYNSLKYIILSSNVLLCSQNQILYGQYSCSSNQER